MSLATKINHDLLRNRVHDLADLAMEINASVKNASTANFHASANGAHIVIKGAPGLIRASALPPLVTTARALSDLEAIIADVRAFTGGGQ
ncbi:hypothetical protein [Vreelandella populi]|uniref:hypothetical protein n=1 Tax=Vreelandella populi TaxID=2498858 RepID=UPI000F8CAD70|nr:hypothetical protein [Halomonas populi]RUR51498.1 hypothetical protein ELY40_17025 [Halomonas populi]